MSDSNRVRVAVVKETTFGTTPSSPRMRTMRTTGESLKYAPKFSNSNEIRADRMNADPVKVNEENQGAVNFELSYPVDLSPLSETFASGLYNSWVCTPYRDNDGTTDSVITQVTSSTGTITVASGTTFVLGHLVRFNGFASAANNGLFRCTTGSTTSPIFVSQGLIDDAAPAAAARMKVVGFQGVAADITATATGLASTTLDFTTLGLVVGQWIKIGSSATACQFATVANNDWARVTAIAAHAITLDNLPTGWAVDAGTGKTINVFFGDYIRNGTTRSSLTIERGFLDQTTPTYIAQKGMVVGQFDLKFDTEQSITGSATFSGLSGSQSTAALSATPDAATTNQVMSASVSVARIAEAGMAISSPNWSKSLSLSINNNLRSLAALGAVGAVDMGAGACAITGTMETYFGSNAMLQKLMNGTVSNLNARSAKNNQALVLTLPRVMYTDGAPNAGQQNQDVTLSLSFTASVDTTTNSMIQFDRVEYFE